MRDLLKTTQDHPEGGLIKMADGTVCRNILPAHLTDPKAHNPQSVVPADCFCSPLRTEVENVRILVHRNKLMREVRE